VSVACPALGHDPAVGDVESGEQGCRTVALVVMGKAVSIAEAHWQHRLASFQRLDLALLMAVRIARWRPRTVLRRLWTAWRVAR
jgi:hypothetical protein